MKPSHRALILVLAALLLGTSLSIVTQGSAQGEPRSAPPAGGPYLRLRGGDFDPLGGPASLPRQAGLPAVQARAASGRRLWLVQFPGPIQREWVLAMQTTGLEVVSYLADYGYLVWSESAGIERLRAVAPLRWSGPFDPAFALHPALSVPGGLPAELDVLVQLYRSPETGASLAEIFQAAGRLNRPAQDLLHYTELGVRLPADRLGWLVSLPGVVDVEPQPEYTPQDEVQDQVLAGNLTPDGGGPSGPGYLAWLRGLGFPETSSLYPIVDLTDDGIDNGGTSPLHPDFYTQGDRTQASRLVYNLNWTSDPTAASTGGHGNLTAAIAGGYNDRVGSAYQDAQYFSYGLGVNPFGPVAGSKIINLNKVVALTGASFAGVVENTYLRGGRLSSNSWGCNTPGSCLGRYNLDAQAYDALVRDARPGVEGNQEVAIFMAAGNNGPSGGSVTPPGTAKNVITVGAAESVRPGWTDPCGVPSEQADSANDVAMASGRGLTLDGRAKPDLVAPGTHIIGAASQAPGYAGICSANLPYYPPGQTLYTAASGTSFSTPAAAGAAALLWRYFQDHLGGNPPSPAMVKAYLVNSARYLNGSYAAGSLPAPGQGYGELDLGLAFDGTPRAIADQNYLFRASGEQYLMTVTVTNTLKPLRVTLAWTDAPGPVIGQAAVNNLDLEVTAGGQTYPGNCFNGALSTTGCSADPVNNLESVFLPAGISGPVVVRVKAANIAGDGVPGNADPSDQDFALVVYNGRPDPAPPPRLSLVKSAPANAEAGLPLRYTLTVTNTGGPSAGITVRDPLPPGTTFKSASHHGTLFNGQVNWGSLSLPGNGLLSLSLDVTVTCQAAGTPLVNRNFLAFASEWLTPTLGTALTSTVTRLGAAAEFSPPALMLSRQPAVFTNLSQRAGGYRWDFGDGASSTSAQPEHTYALPGVYTATLTAANGCSTSQASHALRVDDDQLSLGSPRPGRQPGPGEMVTFTVRLTNTGSLADSYALALNNPPGWAAGLAASQVGPVPAGTGLDFQAVMTAPLSANVGDLHAITVTATSQSDPRLPPASASQRLEAQVTSLADLQAGLQASTEPALLGVNLLYTLVVTNSGPTAASAVRLSLSLPDGLSFQSAPSCSFSPAGPGVGTVSCPLALLAPGGSFKRAVYLRPEAEGLFKLIVTVSSAVRDPNPADNFAVWSSRVIHPFVYLPAVRKR